MLQNVMGTYQSSNGYGMSDRATSALAPRTAAASKESAQEVQI